MNNTNRNVAEFMEGRVLIEGNNQQCPRIQAQNWKDTKSGLLTVRELALKDRKQQFTNLLHHINEGLLRESFFQTQKELRGRL